MHLAREALRTYLAERTVLVTGAGGSIGTELTQQLQALQPAYLVLVDRSEHNLFTLEQRLPPSDRTTFCLADVGHTEAMGALFAAHQPDVVLHAAAYKHVPLMERHPAAAFRNNTLATMRLLRLSAQHRIEQFVFVSTDKAVAPISVLGATKQLAEWAVRHASSSETTCKIVRFGNVFGSRGSVVPLFFQQLADGGPLKVTHPDMTRHFMTAREASSLILQTLLLDAAPVYALKMGESVRIQWLAEEILRRFAPACTPADHIVYTGRRPGEKLSEQLQTASETVRASDHPRILGLHGPVPMSPDVLDEHLGELQRQAEHHAVDTLRQMLISPRAAHSSDAA